MFFELSVEFFKMTSLTTLIYILLVCIITIIEAGKKNGMNKIVIHVPYKIHKHHHTHTKYKLITIPTPKKENTVIYLKEEIQPIIQHVPTVKTHTEIIETPKISESFIPPHQESAKEFLSNHKDEILTQTEQEEFSTILDDQKPLESHITHSNDRFVTDYTYKPMIIQPQNFIPLKPILYSQNPFTSKLMHPFIHNDFIPKFTYQTMYHQPDHFNTKFTFKSMLPPTKDLQDNVAHTSNQIYKTIITPTPKTVKSYKVKEETVEDIHSNLHSIPVPSIKFNRKGKSNMHSAFNNQIKNPIMEPGTDYEYEHVGYLIINGNNRKMVGKNFKDEIHLSR